MNTMTEHILVVEDEEVMKLLLRSYLENVGYCVTAVASGGGIFPLLQSETIDLVVLDLGLPDGDGVAWLREIRQRYDIPVVIVTARTGIDDRLSTLGVGAEDFVSKPVEPRELQLRVRNILNRKRQASGRPKPTPDPASMPRANPRLPITDPSAAAGKSGDEPAPPDNKRDAVLWAAIGGVVAATIAVGAFLYLDGRQPAPVENAEFASDEWPAGLPSRRPEEGSKTPLPAAVSNESQQVPEQSSEGIRRSQPVDRPVPAVELLRRSVPSRPATAPVAPSATPRIPDAASVATKTAAYGWVFESQCDDMPDVAWWRIKTRLEVVRYVNDQLNGNWSTYLRDWRARYEKLKAIHDRRSGVRTPDGRVLQGDALAGYVADTAARLAAIQCLTLRHNNSNGRRSSRNGFPGLGLGIAQATVEKHQGRIGCDSSDGETTTFQVSLPGV